MYRHIITSIIVFFLIFSSATAQDLDKILQPVQIGNKDEKPKLSEKDLAYQYYTAQEFDKAAVIYEELYKKEKTSYYYKYLLYSLVGSQQYGEAEKLVSKTMKNNKLEEMYYVDLGYIKIAEGDKTKGVKYYEEALSKLKADPNNIQSLANAFTAIRENLYSIKTYEKGRKLLNNDQLFSAELAYRYYYTQEYAKMVEEFLKYAEYRPNQKQYVCGRFQDYMSNDPEGTITEAIKNGILSNAKKEKDDSYFFTDMALWFFIQVKEFDLAYKQAAALDKRADGHGKYLLDLADICISNNKYETAAACYQYIITSYKNEPVCLDGKIGLVNMSYEILKTQEVINEEDVAALDQQFAAVFEETGMNLQTLDLSLNYADFKAFYKKEYAQAVTMLEDMLKIGGRITKAETAKIKLTLGDVYIVSGDQWEATLLYSQVEKLMKDEALGDEAKYKNAELFYYLGEYNWAEAKLDILKTSVDKFIANDAMKLSLFIKNNKGEDTVSYALRYFSKAELAFFKKQTSIALLYLDSAATVNAWNPIEDDVLYKKAEIYISLRNYVVADSLLKMICDNYSTEILADEAMYTRAVINDIYLNNSSLAQQLYQNVFVDYSESVFAIPARNRFRELRGDVKNEESSVSDPNLIYAPLLKQ